MTNPELPDQPDDIDKARLDWAASFLVDWLIPLLNDDLIDDPSQIKELREGFPPLVPENKMGIDFTLEDVLRAAERMDEFIERKQQDDPSYTHEYAEPLKEAIDLLERLLYF